MSARQTRVLVTGGTGFLGTHLVAAWREQRVINIGRRTNPHAENISVDLSNGELTLKENCFDTVYHLAGLAHRPPRTKSEAEAFYHVNAQGTANLLAALERSPELPQSFVLISTVAVYGCFEGVSLTEDSPRAATDPYGESKRIAEDAVMEWGARWGVRVGIVRLPLIAGRNAPGNLGAMVDALRRNRYLRIGDGAARRSMVWVGDVVEVLPQIAQAGGTFHLTDGHHPSFRELDSALADALGKKRVRVLPLACAKAAARAGDVWNSVLNTRAPLDGDKLRKMTSTLIFSDERARAKLGWCPSRVVDYAKEMVS